MATGISARHSADIGITDMSPEEFLLIALETANKLEWKLSEIYENGLKAYTSFSIISYGEEITIEISEGSAHILSECIGTQLYSWGRNKRNIQDFVSSFNEVRFSLSPEEMEQKRTELRQRITLGSESAHIRTKTIDKPKIKGFLSIFVPAKDYFVTPLIINVNILVFIAMLIGGVNFLLPGGESLLAWGANMRPLTGDGQWWRLLTSCFVHIGIFHLLMNMYALLYIGLLLEPILGKVRFLTAYILTGIFASLASFWWHPATISAGASGAIFGMYGVFLALLTTRLLERSMRKTFLVSILIFVAYNLMNGLKGNIDNAAHVGGLLSGLAMGYAFVPGLKNPESKAYRLATISFVGMMLIALSAATFVKVPNDFAAYQEKMEKFARMESMAMEVANMSPNTPKEEVLHEIKDRGIYYWKKNLEIVNEIRLLDLPVELLVRNDKVEEYCNLRIQMYELVYKSIDEDSDVYQKDLEDLAEKINNLVDDLVGKGS